MLNRRGGWALWVLVLLLLFTPPVTWGAIQQRESNTAATAISFARFAARHKWAVLLLMPPISLRPGLMWSVQPHETSILTTEGVWLDVDNTAVTFLLDNEAVIMVSYSLAAMSSKAFHAGGDFLNDNQVQSGARDFIGCRLTVDGVPYRQSGSHISPAGSLESSIGTLEGYLVTELGPGTHTIALQWRKWGSYVRSWSNRPNFEDGQVSGRSITVTAHHRFVLQRACRRA